MKTIIKNPSEITSGAVILTYFQDNQTSQIQKHFNEKLVNLENLTRNFEAKLGDSLVFPYENNMTIIALGLGKKEEFDFNKMRFAIAKGVLAAVKYTKQVLSIELPSDQDVLNLVIGAYMGEYKFDKYKNNENKIQTLQIITTGDDIENSIHKACIISDAMNFTKDLVFESAQVMTPAKVSEIATELAQNNNLEIKIYDKDELKQMGFNAFLAVSQGSVQPPKFIHLIYKTQNPIKKVALIGKGITFDSGGLDIKPAASMVTMKTDMTGCATVLGVLKAICELKPDIELHVISALCENMPSGSSYKVGDVIVSKSKKTIEVDNTDAEGRLTLADALSFADELNVDEVIDIATLTGAVIVALGNNITGIMGNNQNQIDEFKKAAEYSGEPVWQLPIYDDMQDKLKSDIADMKNTGSKGAGSSVAGRFLQNFTKSEKWLHIDIAGTAYIDKSYKEIQKGATAVMVRSLINYLTKN